MVGLRGQINLRCTGLTKCVIGFSAAGLVRTFTEPVCIAYLHEENSKCTISWSYLAAKRFSPGTLFMGLIFHGAHLEKHCVTQ